MTHTAHPPVHESGLADDCPACGRLAEEPWKLDREALADLIDRTLRNRFGYHPSGFSPGMPPGEAPFGDLAMPRTDMEARAMAVVLTELELFGQLAQAAPDKLALYLAERWRVALPAREPATT